eukprot:4725569-Pleurochrysis_carterae.AAC.5
MTLAELCCVRIRIGSNVPGHKRERSTRVVASCSDLKQQRRRNVLASVSAITLALASSVERVLRSGDLAMRSSVLRDLRARFSPKDKPAGVDAGVQATAQAVCGIKLQFTFQPILDP